MALATNLGFPRVGRRRELKNLIESFWAGKITEAALLEDSHRLRVEHWQLQQKHGIDQVPVGDASLYDHVLDTSVTFGAIPPRYRHLKPGLETYFAMGRGLQKPASADGSIAAVDVPAMEMKKWFDTNYHYIVPEFAAQQTFRLTDTPKILREYEEARAAGVAQPRPVLVGPVSYLLLGKADRDVTGSFDRFALLPSLLDAYVELLQRLAAAGATWIQVDEPFLALDLSDAARTAFTTAYARLSTVAGIRILLATYFASITDSNLDLLAQLPVAGYHIDLVRAPEQLDAVLSRISASQRILSLGLVDGRNVWRTDLQRAFSLAQRAVTTLGGDASRVWIAASSSLLHSPHSFADEAAIDAEILAWLAGATEKLEEIHLLTRALNEGVEAVRTQFDANTAVILSRQNSKRTRKPAVRERLAAVTDDQLRRKSPFTARQKVQREKLGLPRFPTTTVGSFPQTREVRLARVHLRKGEWTQSQYDQFIREEIERAVRFQERIGLDVLVHGESERNDMVEYFGEQLDGYVFSKFGWVSSYGTRCVKPPIIYGDIERPRAMTVDIIKYAQSLTSRAMKGMLTGPITCLQWSFVRDDQPRRDTAFQLALAIRDEVTDLEAAGVPVVQIDEPAIREGLPLHRADWDAYLQWSVDAFLLSSTGVSDTTQIHTHMCYSDFNDIFPAIQRLDADVITIENSRSDLKLLEAFDRHAYTNEIGPGVYDIHSPRVPSTEEMLQRARELLKYLPADLLWINPDCGLKTRGWPEVDAALTNLVAVARTLRSEHSA